jgi:NNP family nitrate/nitrite transporter-like MFS transporter
MISEWFPAKQTGTAQGIYGGWGNFGSAGAAFCLPFIASSFGEVNGFLCFSLTGFCLHGWFPQY